MPGMLSALTWMRYALAVLGCGFMLATGTAGTAAGKGREVAVDFDYAPESVNLAGRGLMARIEMQPDFSGALWHPRHHSIVSGLSCQVRGIWSTRP